MRLNRIPQYLLMCTSLLIMLPHANSEFIAGAAKSTISIPSEVFPTPFENFVSVHDSLMARLVIMDDGNTRACILVLDQTSISDATLQELKSILKKAANVEPANSLIVAAHGFSAPHVIVSNRSGQPEEDKHKMALLEIALEDATRNAAIQAVANLRHAKVGFAKGSSSLAVNRDVPTSKGWWLGSNEEGFSDREFDVLRINDSANKPIAEIVNCGVQSSVMDGSTLRNGGRAVSADIEGVITAHTDDALGNGSTSLFMIGAAADQAPYLVANPHVVDVAGSVSRVDMHEDGFALVKMLGERFAQTAVQVSEETKVDEVPSLKVLRKSFEVSTQIPSEGIPKEPVVSYKFVEGPKEKVPVVFLQLGKSVIVGLQAELTANIGAMIKRQSSYQNTIVATMVDGAAKYMPDESSYDRITYEARNSHYARSSAEIIAKKIIETLAEMKNGK